MIKVEKNFNVQDYTGEVKNFLESIIAFEKYCKIEVSESSTNVSIRLLFGHMSMDIYFFKEDKNKEYKFIKIEYGNFVCTINEGLKLDITIDIVVKTLKEYSEAVSNLDFGLKSKLETYDYEFNNA